MSNHPKNPVGAAKVLSDTNKGLAAMFLTQAAELEAMGGERLCISLANVRDLAKMLNTTAEVFDDLAKVMETLGADAS